MLNEPKEILKINVFKILKINVFKIFEFSTIHILNEAYLNKIKRY